MRCAFAGCACRVAARPHAVNSAHAFFHSSRRWSPSRSPHRSASPKPTLRSKTVPSTSSVLSSHPVSPAKRRPISRRERRFSPARIYDAGPRTRWVTRWTPRRASVRPTTVPARAPDHSRTWRGPHPDPARRHRRAGRLEHQSGPPRRLRAVVRTQCRSAARPDHLAVRQFGRWRDRERFR